MSTSLYDTCDSCGKRGCADDDFFTYTFGGYAGYGSKHDGEFILLHICAECLDKMLGRRQPERTENTGT